jgi:hypothetical protein
MSSSAQCSSAGCENYSIPALPSSPKLTTLKNSVRRLYFTHINISHIGALDIDYRHFDSANIEPRYEFGYGMSYTTFRYSHLSVKLLETTQTLAGADKACQPGGITSLYADALKVTFTVKNTGAYDGNEVAQLYIVCLFAMPVSTPTNLLLIR